MPSVVASYNRPKYLYKFRMGSARDVDNLRNGNIWLPTFKKMNDPHDGQLGILIEKALQMHGVIGFPIRDESTGATFFLGGFRTTAEDCIHDPSVISKYRDEVKEMQDFYKNCGVYSLSETMSCPQMWAHYAANSTGFCIEYGLFDSEGKMFPDAEYFYPVTYVEEYPKIDLFSLKNLSEGERLPLLLGRKEKRWGVEKEWRWICPDGDYVVPHPLQVVSVIVGANSTECLINDIKEACAESNVVLKRSIKVDGQFEFGVELL